MICAAPNPLRILHVENDENWAHLVHGALKDLGVAYTHVSNVSDALASIESPGKADLVLIDLHLGERNGDEIVQAICERNDGTPFIIISGTLSRGAIKKLDEASGLAIEKDLVVHNPDEFRARVQNLLKTSREMAGTINLGDCLIEVRRELASAGVCPIAADDIRGSAFRALQELNCSHLPEEELIALKNALTPVGLFDPSPVEQNGAGKYRSLHEFLSCAKGTLLRTIQDGNYDLYVLRAAQHLLGLPVHDLLKTLRNADQSATDFQGILDSELQTFSDLFPKIGFNQGEESCEWAKLGSVQIFPEFRKAVGKALWFIGAEMESRGSAGDLQLSRFISEHFGFNAAHYAAISLFAPFQLTSGWVLAGRTPDQVAQDCQVSSVSNELLMELAALQIQGKLEISFHSRNDGIEIDIKHRLPDNAVPRPEPKPAPLPVEVPILILDYSEVLIWLRNEINRIQKPKYWAHLSLEVNHFVEKVRDLKMPGVLVIHPNYLMIDQLSSLRELFSQHRVLVLSHGSGGYAAEAMEALPEAILLEHEGRDYSDDCRTILNFARDLKHLDRGRSPFSST